MRFVAYWMRKPRQGRMRFVVVWMTNIARAGGMVVFWMITNETRVLLRTLPGRVAV
jgi:hypothetical protein